MMPLVAIVMALLLVAFAAGLVRDVIDERYDREVRRIYSSAPEDGAFPYLVL